MKLVRSEQNIHFRNKRSLPIEAIRTYYLAINNGLMLDLKKAFYISSFSINLIFFLQDLYHLDIHLIFQMEF